MIRVYHHIWPFNFGLSISEEQKKRVYQFIKDDFTYHPNMVEKHENENQTLQKLINEIDLYDNDDFVLYIHTKGATYNKLVQRQWREYMESDLIDDYKSHINILLKGFDTSGVLMGIPVWSDRIYGGNFWWAKVEFLKKIPKNLNEHLNFNVRHDAEFKFLQLVPDWNPYTKPFFRFGMKDEFCFFIVKDMFDSIFHKTMYRE